MAEAKKNVSLKVTADLLESKEAKQIPKGFAYAFCGSRLLDHRPLNNEGKATLTFPATKEARSIQVLVAPEAEAKGLIISDLTRRGAEAIRFRLNPENLSPATYIPVVPQKWLCWLLSWCYVKGRLLKRVTTGGVEVERPVCDATVEVYEVDPLWVIVVRLSDLEILKLIEVILELARRGPIHFPEPLPEPPAPGPPPPPEARLKRFAAAIRGPAGTSGCGGCTEMSATPALPSGAMEPLTAEPQTVPSELVFLAKTASPAHLRQALVKYPEISRILICRYFSHHVKKDLVAVAETDDCGRFQTSFYRGCNNPDVPDLYFIAKQQIDPPPSPPTTIYHPVPVYCYTYWQYKCGTEVILYTSHHLARTCAPCLPVVAPDNWVLVNSVGNLPLNQIYGTSQALQAGITPANLGLTGSGSPFGGLLRLHLEFDNSLRQHLNVMYYRVSYRKGTTGSFIDLNGACSRHYSFKVGKHLVLKVYPLGPMPAGTTANLFEIPPGAPPTGKWVVHNLVEDQTNAKFNTADVAPGLNPPAQPTDYSGKFQLKIDLFDNAGNLVNIDALGINYCVPKEQTPSGDILTDDAAALGLVLDDDGDGKKSFIMTLHVDNNACTADIATPTLDGTPASPNCGVLEYAPGPAGSVTMNFTASHPHGFATYSFELYRGGALAIPAQSGSVGGGSYTITKTAADLLGGCAVAGFAEHLHVWATATDGWSRLSEYDAHDVEAFVLSPVKPPETL